MTRVKTNPIVALASAMLLLILAIDGAGQSRASESPASVAAVPKAEEVYRNVRFLRGVPYDQFIPTMYMFAESLGVECDHCHEANRVSDAKPTKQIAGKMLQMVERINRESFDGSPKVTCFSCHRGSPKPVDMPVLHSTEGKSPSDDAKNNRRTFSGVLPTVDQLIEKYMTALGGAAAIQKISNRVEKGTVNQNRPGGGPLTKLSVEATAETPGKRITKGFSVTHLGNSPDAYGVYNGDYGWVREGSGPVRVMWDSRRDAAQLEDTLNFAPHLKQLVRRLTVEQPEEIGGKEAYVISGRMSALPLVRLYFDADSGLLVRLVYHTESAVGPVPTQIDYADYREVDGVKIPFRWTVELVRSVHLTYQLDEVRQNVPIDETIFAKPSPPPPMY